MIFKALISIVAASGGLLYIDNLIGGEIASLAEDTQEWPSCDNCIGSVDSRICRFCDDGSCWVHKNDDAD